MLEQRKSVRSPPPEEEGVAKTTGGGLTTTPIPCPPTPLMGEEVEQLGTKLSPGRREGWEEGVSVMWLYFSLSYSVKWWW